MRHKTHIAYRTSLVLVAALYLTFLLSFIAVSAPRRVGDGGEYLAMTMNLAAARPPSLSPSDLHRIEKRFQEIGRGYETVPLEMPALRGRDGRQDFPHFWLYPLLAVPALWIVDAIGAHPNYAFTLLNLGVAISTLLLIVRSVSIPVALLILAGPLIWWMDKAHADVFTVSLMAAGFGLLAKADLKGPPYEDGNLLKGPREDDRGLLRGPREGDRGVLKDPRDRDRGVALIALGAAAAQNPPLAPVFALVVLTVVFKSFGVFGARGPGPPARLKHGARGPAPEARLEHQARSPEPEARGTEERRAHGPAHGARGPAPGPRTIAGAAAGLALAALPVIYYELRLGLPTPIVGWTKFHIPSIREIGAFIWDPNIGLFVNDPIFAITVVAASIVAVRRRRVTVLTWWLPLACALVLLVGFAQSINMNHGATPGMNRWTQWLMALAVPLLADIEFVGGASRALGAAAIASTMWSVIWFQPARGEDYKTPTRTAEWIWTRAPTLDDPPAEIFAERVSHTEPPQIPVAFADCRKVLAIDGLWPVPCLPPLDPQAACTAAGAACYANDTGSGYRFVQIRFPEGLDFTRARAWPLQASFARHLRGVLDDIGVQGLTPAAAGQSGAMLRAAHGVPWTYSLQAADRMFVYLPEAEDDASLTMRLPGPMAGSFVDLMSGERLVSVVRAGAPWTAWDVKVPAGRRYLALTMKKAG